MRARTSLRTLAARPMSRTRSACGAVRPRHSPLLVSFHPWNARFGDIADFTTFADEEAKYNYDKPGYADATGHFTQMVRHCSLCFKAPRPERDPILTFASLYRSGRGRLSSDARKLTATRCRSPARVPG